MINLPLKNLELIIFKLIFIRAILKYATTHNHLKSTPQRPTTTHKHPQPSTTTQKTTHNHPQPPKNYLKKQRFVTNSDVPPQWCSYWKRRWVLIVIRNNGIYTCVCVCVRIYLTSHYIDFFLFRLVICFCQH